MPDVIIPRRWLKRHFNRQTEKEGEVVTSLSVDNRISLDGIFFLNDRWQRVFSSSISAFLGEV